MTTVGLLLLCDSDKRDDVAVGRRDGFQSWGWKLLLRVEIFPQLAREAVSGRRDGNGPHMAGGLNEGDGGRNVIPRLDVAVAPAKPKAGVLRGAHSA